MYDWRGFSSLPHFDSRSRRRCGNVGTRVLCGFPSSEGGQNRCGRDSIIPPSERHFHNEGPFYRPFCRECAVRAADGAEMAPFGKPRRMHDFTDSRSEPNDLSPRRQLYESRHPVHRHGRAQGSDRDRRAERRWQAGNGVDRGNESQQHSAVHPRSAGRVGCDLGGLAVRSAATPGDASASSTACGRIGR